nr:MAG TPA: hypothetical protein [Caudoviricetes sp.]
MKSYKELKERQQEEINKFSFGFAFDNKQFKDMMNKWGLDENDTNKIIRVFSGTYILKSDKTKLDSLLKRHDDELKKAMQDDGFLQSAFEYEMSNQEYIITYNDVDVISSLGLSLKDFENDKRLLENYKIAKDRYIEEMNRLGW